MEGTSCDCTFAYWSVIPPTHCPKCGRCLTCGHGTAPWPVSPYPYPVHPQVTGPWPSRWYPNTTITYTTSASTSPNIGMVA